MTASERRSRSAAAADAAAAAVAPTRPPPLLQCAWMTSCFGTQRQGSPQNPSPEGTEHAFLPRQSASTTPVELAAEHVALTTGLGHAASGAP